ncbi:MAG: hypothetical protein K2Q06_10035 [Parvularculaceae bacterium]|nr:hypothetical protein [Parvularculaceae bacterium]
MTDELHTDDLSTPAKIALTLRFVAELVFREARGLALAASDKPASDDEDASPDAGTRRLTSLVIALQRITEMDDRYHDRAAGRAGTAEERERYERAVEREVERLRKLSPDAVRRELEDGSLARALGRKDPL